MPATTPPCCVLCVTRVAAAPPTQSANQPSQTQTRPVHQVVPGRDLPPPVPVPVPVPTSAVPSPSSLLHSPLPKYCPSPFAFHAHPTHIVSALLICLSLCERWSLLASSPFTSRLVPLPTTTSPESPSQASAPPSNLDLDLDLDCIRTTSESLTLANKTPPADGRRGNTTTPTKHYSEPRFRP